MVISAVFLSMAPTEQYLSYESCMARSTASLLMFFPLIRYLMWIFVKTSGGSSALSAWVSTL